MKRLILAFAFIAVCWSCANNTNNKAKEPQMTIIKGERATYGVLGSDIFLPTKDSTEFDVKIYQGETGLMLESPKILISNLFGIKSTTGNRDRLKYSFTFIGKSGDKYLYGIPYTDLPSFHGNYYTLNLEYCWVHYQFDDMSNATDIVEFSKAEFEDFFDIVKAHIVNY